MWRGLQEHALAKPFERTGTGALYRQINALNPKQPRASSAGPATYRAHARPLASVGVPILFWWANTI
jgi:hypothetical protein